MSNIDPTTARVRDPLSQVTRSNRNLLLAFSLVGVLFVQVGLVPDTLSVFGNKFSNWEGDSLVSVNIVVCLFYFASFVVSSISDYFILKMQIFEADTIDDAAYEQLIQREADDELTEQDNILLYRHRTHRWIFGASNSVGRARLTIEFILPALFALYAVIIMTCYVWPI